MQIWHYDPQTGELIGSSLAHESPLEPGVFLIPAWATSTAPPSPGARQAAVFRDDTWSIEPDYRGETWYTANAVPVVVNALGDPATAGLLQVAPDLPPPPIQVPAQVTNYQLRKALLDAGLFAAVDAAIKALPVTSEAYQGWEYGNSFLRSSPSVEALVGQLAAAQGVPLEQANAQVDQLFIAASTVVG